MNPLTAHDHGTAHSQMQSSAPLIGVLVENTFPSVISKDHRISSFSKESREDEYAVDALDFYYEELPNLASYKFCELKFTGSVLPKVALVTLFFTLYSTFWTMLYFLADLKILAVSNQLITVISGVLGLLLVFRTNSSYLKFEEARRLWTSLISHSRNFSRIVWINCKSNDDKELQEKVGALNILLAFAVATKHDLRREKGIHYRDLRSLLTHIPLYKPGHSHVISAHVALDLTIHLSAYVIRCKELNKIDAATTVVLSSIISSLVEVYSNLGRIRDYPVPAIYRWHLQHTILLYLLFLPFQVLTQMGWSTIIVQMVASFTLLGIDAIGQEIENPMGNAPNDLPLDHICNELEKELTDLKLYPVLTISPLDWTTPMSMAARH